VLINPGTVLLLTFSKEAAASVQAKITGPSGVTKKYSTLLWYLPTLIERERRKGKRGPKAEGSGGANKRQQKRKVRVVLAKAEGQQQQQKKSKGRRRDRRRYTRRKRWNDGLIVT
jgi:hypothetical protein